MSLQYDFESAFDITGLATITKIQLMEFVLKLGPVNNIGGVIVMSSEDSAHPDVTNNPRFTRYVWIDNVVPTAPVLKLYIGEGGSDTSADWVESGLTDGSVTSDKIAQFAVSLLTYAGQSRIAYKQDGTADASKANFLVRINAAGQYLEIASASSVVNSVTHDISKLSTVGASDGMLLTYSSALGYAKWATISLSSVITDDSIAYSKLLDGDAGTAKFILRAAATAPYAIELASNDDSVSDLLAQRSVRINRLDDTGASAGDRIHFAGGDWVKFTPFYGPSTSGGTTVPTSNGGGQLLAPHGLGVVPKIFECFLICNSADLNYAVGDRVKASSLMADIAASTELAGAVSVYADATNVVANFFNAANASRYFLVNDTTFLRNTAIDVTKWDVYFYAQP